MSEPIMSGTTNEAIMQVRKTENPNKVFLNRQKCRSCGDTYDADGLTRGPLDGYCGLCIVGAMNQAEGA